MIALSKIQGDWLYLLPLVIGVGLCLLVLILSKRRARLAEKKRQSAKKYEEYCRLYETGQRESDDAGFRKHVQDRKDHDDFIQRQKKLSVGPLSPSMRVSSAASIHAHPDGDFKMH